MIDTCPNTGELYNWLEIAVSTFKGRFILLEQLHERAKELNSGMPAYLQSPPGMAAFQQAVRQLVAEQILAPVGKKPATPQGLHLKYRVIKSPVIFDAGCAADIIRSIAPPAVLDYYLKNPQDFKRDQPIIDIISNFLRQPQRSLLTVNERAYQLFGDEKFFKGAGKNRSRGETVLRRLGLVYADIGCRETVEPFFSFQSKVFHALANRDIYIIENKDTFWSFKEQTMDKPARIKADLIIYGEGKKIISSFRFVEEYAVNLQRDRFYYFGDLDPEGINIYCLLSAEYPQYDIQPFVAGYQAVLEIGLNKAPVKTPKEQRLIKENVEQFLHTFSPPWAAKIKEHLEQGFYIPQEALSAEEMRERFGVK
ncbi:MAG: hypothetical protein BWY65_01129 [Firmicutes bacterium ADurb.Bin373]|nr:MAG: hypothetical protein BWY65_01129 [Firmicutes bacterium ADurb.Bin373]